MAKDIKRAVTDALELPREVALNLPFITMTGREEIYIENYKGIIEYSDKKMRINTGVGVLKIEGGELCLKNLTAESLTVSGSILRLEYLI